jgi:hypothetical protein
MVWIEWIIILTFKSRLKVSKDQKIYRKSSAAASSSTISLTKKKQRAMADNEASLALFMEITGASADMARNYLTVGSSAMHMELDVCSYTMDKRSRTATQTMP